MAECRFCGGPVVIHPDTCQRCLDILHVVEDANYAVLNRIITFVRVHKFLRELFRKQR